MHVCTLTDDDVGAGQIAAEADAAIIPDWARSQIALTAQCDAGVARIIVSDNTVLLHHDTSTSAVPETADALAEGATAQHTYTSLTTKQLDVHVPGKQCGAPVGSIDVVTLNDGTKVAVLKRQLNGSLLVIEAATSASDHYVIELSGTVIRAGDGAAGEAAGAGGSAVSVAVGPGDSDGTTGAVVGAGVGTENAATRAGVGSVGAGDRAADSVIRVGDGAATMGAGVDEAAKGGADVSADVGTAAPAAGIGTAAKGTGAESTESTTRAA